MTSTTPLVRCKDCQFAPPIAYHKRFICEAGINSGGYTYWRRCGQYQSKAQKGLDEQSQRQPLELVQSKPAPTARKPRWEIFRAEFDDLWVGTEPLWSWAWDERSENEVLEELRQWLRYRRAEHMRWVDVARRRSQMRSVE